MATSGTRRRLGGDRGAVALHYVLVLVLIALLCAGAVTVMSGWADQLFQQVRNQL